jgi:hypothetical protein
VKTLLACGVALALAVQLSAQGSAPAAQETGDNDLGNVGALGQQVVNRPPPPTGPTPRLPDGTVDLSGLWVGGGPVGDIARQGGLAPGTLDRIMLPWAKDLMAWRAENETQDPHLWCLPMGVPRANPYPFRFVQNYTHKPPTHIFKLEEGNIHSYRQIFMDGRQHPTELDPTWYGHSIGRWDGDTLVIDTVGFNDKFWFDRSGTPHTEQLHTIERWTRVDEGHLELEVTIDDPGAYTEPWTVKFTARLQPPGDEIMEYICQENNQFGAAGGHRAPEFRTTAP